MLEKHNRLADQYDLQVGSYEEELRAENMELKIKNLQLEKAVRELQASKPADLYLVAANA